MINIRTLKSLVKAKPAPETATAPAVESLDAEKLTRRAALRRIGMTGGMTILGVLSIDELARVSARKLEQNELTRGIAAEFKNAGVAVADLEEATEMADAMTRAKRWFDACKGICDERYANKLSPAYVDCMDACRAGWKRRVDNAGLVAEDEEALDDTDGGMAF